MVFVPLRPWKSLSITRLENFQSRNQPTDFAEEARNGTVRRLAEAVKATGIVPESKHNRLTTEIRYLQEGPENFGEVDLRNQQQVELLAYRLARGGIPRRARGGRLHSGRIEVYDLAIIGSGSTAAY